MRSEDLQILIEKVGSSRRTRILQCPSIENPRNDVGIVHVSVDKGSNPSWTELREESGDLQVHELWGDWQFILCNSKFGGGQFFENIECEGDWPKITVVKSWSKTKVRVYSDSTPFGKLSSGAEAKVRWLSQVKEFQMYYLAEKNF